MTYMGTSRKEDATQRFAVHDQQFFYITTFFLKNGAEHTNVKVCHKSIHESLETGGEHYPPLPFNCSKLRYHDGYLNAKQEEYMKQSQKLLLPSGEETENYCLAYKCEDGEEWKVQYQSCPQRNIRKVKN